VELTPVDTSRQKRMPKFAGGTHAHIHSVHSALECLEALAIPAHRIVLRRSGREASAPGTIVRQSPAPGTALSSNSMIELEIAGLGFTHVLPVGMWDSGGEAAAGTREILQPFDDPLEKLKHWFAEGAPLFRISPEDPAACARWLALFGVSAEEWPRALWFRLASLVAQIPHFSCSETGCAFVLNALFGLPVRSFTYHVSSTLIPEEDLSRLGTRAAHLGTDFLLGDAMENLAVLHIELGPVPLSTYEQFQETHEGVSLLRRTLALIMPLSTAHEVRWSVLDETQPPQLGIAERNSRLGVNTHLGSMLETMRVEHFAADNIFIGSQA
jgi:hypothetical protein